MAPSAAFLYVILSIPITFSGSVVNPSADLLRMVAQLAREYCPRLPVPDVVEATRAEFNRRGERPLDPVGASVRRSLDRDAGALPAATSGW